MHESRIGEAPVGDAVFLAGDGAHTHAARRKNRFALDLEIGHELRELAAKFVEAPRGAQVA